MKNSLRIHKWTHNEFNIFILGVLTRPHAALIVYHCFRAEKECFIFPLAGVWNSITSVNDKERGHAPPP